MKTRLISLLLASLAVVVPSVAESAPKPNIIVILVDDMGF